MRERENLRTNSNMSKGHNTHFSKDVQTAQQPIPCKWQNTHQIKSQRDGSVSKSTCGMTMKAWVQILRTHVSQLGYQQLWPKHWGRRIAGTCSLPAQLQLQWADILPGPPHEFTMGTSTHAMHTHMYAHIGNQINSNKRRTQADEWQGTHCTFGLGFNWQQRSKPKRTPWEPTAHLLEWPLSKKPKPECL